MLKRFFLNIINKKTYINNYKIIIKIFIRSRNKYIKKEDLY